MTRKLVNYNGKMVVAEDCTPTWLAAAEIHMSCLQYPDASDKAKDGAVKEIRKMARLADEYVNADKRLFWREHDANAVRIWTEQMALYGKFHVVTKHEFDIFKNITMHIGLNIQVVKMED